MSASLHPLPCGCCETAAPPTPVLPINRPGLPTIAYRVGTFASFREAMVRAIREEPALAGLTTRESDDHAIALLELWAAVADVLTFYQERAANEAYLRTARERDSVLRLVRLLDYELRPGLAATAHLAFTADDAAAVRIDPGLKVMSVPGQDERPQTYETVGEFVARGTLNRIPILPEPGSINPLAQGRQAAFFSPDSAGWQAAKGLRPGDRVVLFGGWDAAAADVPAPEGTYGETLGWGLPDRVVAETGWSAGPSLQEEIAFWKGTAQPSVGGIGVAPVAEAAGAPEEKEIREVRIEGDRYLLVWTSPVVKAGWTPDTEARVYRRKVRIFGHDAPATFTTVRPGSSPSEPPVIQTHTVDPSFTGSGLPLDAAYDDIVVGDSLLVVEGGDTKLVTVTGLSSAECVVSPAPPGDAFADPRHRATVTVATLSEEVSIKDRRNVTIYRLTGPPIPLWGADFSEVIDAGRLCVPAVKLDPVPEAVEIGRTIAGGELKSGVPVRLDHIQPGRPVLLEDHTARPIVAEVTGSSVETLQGEDFLVLEVSTPSPFALETRTAFLLGNIAPATHGETVREEILGDGDAATSFQRFVLSRKPLTYVPSTRRVGGESTLTVLVNGEAWTEVDSLHGQLPADAVYTLRQADDGTTTVQFGDGVTGARLPTGRGNVVARYRQGLGLEGRVKPDQLSILLDRPVGLKSVTNPAPADGGADPETLDRARETAPSSVRTFDRIVSLRDFESLALDSGEAARASATSVWHGLERAVHLTVAGHGGRPLSEDALKRLYSALTSQRDPNRTLLLANACRVPIIFAATVSVDARFVARDVKAECAAALRDFFSFDRMPFAQAIHLSDMYRLLQDVLGVAFVDVNTLHYKGYVDWTIDQLAARGATVAPVQHHLRMLPARARPASGPADPIVGACFGSVPLPSVLPAEQAFVAVEAEDIVLTITGGLE